MLKHVIDIGWTSVRLSVRPSVCPSVTRWHGIKTAEYIVMISSPHDSPIHSSIVFILSVFQILQSTVFVIGQEVFFTVTSLPWLLFSIHIEARFGFSVQASTHFDWAKSLQRHLQYFILSNCWCFFFVLSYMHLDGGQWALNRGANSRRPLDHLQYVFELCDTMTLTFDLLT